MRMPIIFVLVVVLHLLAVLSLQIVLQSSFAQNFSKAIVNENSKFTQYENPDIGIRLSHPSNWGNIVELKEEDCHKQSSCVLGLDSEVNPPYTFGFVLAKYLKESCNCNSLMDFVKSNYKIQSASSGFSFINDNQTTVGKKYPGWQYEYSFLLDGVQETGLSVLTTNNDTYYSIGISYPNESRAKILPDFRKVIDSIEFLAVQNPVTKTPSFLNLNETEESKFNESQDISNALQILSHNSFTDSIGNFHIVGEVKNDLPTTADFVKIVATFYDINNQVVATSFAYTNPSDIGSGQTAPFEILLKSASVPISQIDHYKLQATK